MAPMVGYKRRHSFLAPILPEFRGEWWGDARWRSVPEARIGGAVPVAGDERELVGQDVVIGPVREFRGWAGPTIALVQIAVTRYILEVFHERPVVATLRPVLPRAAP